jgi:3-dehydroquinate synthase
MASTAEETKYDIVKVDLADGRDYPIYIGAGYSQEEGKKHV